ncbi:hypothetical protein [Georgenia sp. 311]|uniref:hypothetical protein n=1 Tax=Georgenia sp. 311 TaxID=2585134 RepID=UPI00159BC800|nr:hypothetical protein [Georgenia sp. 311]
MDVQGWVILALAVVLFGYLVPTLVNSRQQLAEARVEDRFSTTLRVVGTGATARRPSPGEHHGTRENRPYLHDPRRRTEAPAVNRPTTPSERAAAEARRLAAARAARAAEISRRKAAARRRLVLTLLLAAAGAAGWSAVGVSGMSLALGVVPTVLLVVVLVLGRRAAKVAARRNAADRAAMARLELRAEPRRVVTRPAVTAPREEPAVEAPAQEAVAPAVEEVAPTVTAPATTGAPWTPVPVPAPSYTLKAAAPRRDIAPYEAPEPVVARTVTEPVLESGLAGSPYAPVADPQPQEAPAPLVGPARGLDLDSVLARRRAASA